MLPIDREEVQERVRAHLDTRKDRSGDSIWRLLLEGLVEELRIYRIRCGEEKRSRMRRSERHRRRSERDGGRRSRSQEGQRGRSPVRHRDRSWNGRPATQAPRSEPAQDSPFMMSGGAGPPGTAIPTPREEDDDTGMETTPADQNCRRRSPPMGPPPTYKPRLGLTLGFGTHLKNCIKYVAEENEKKARRVERRQRRDARKEAEAKSAQAADARSSKHVHFTAPKHGSHQSSHNRTAVNREGVPASNLRYHKTSHSQTVEERESTQSRSDHEWNPHTGKRESESATDHTYHQTPHSQSVEERERAQRGLASDQNSHIRATDENEEEPAKGTDREYCHPNLWEDLSSNYRDRARN